MRDKHDPYKFLSFPFPSLVAGPEENFKNTIDVQFFFPFPTRPNFWCPHPLTYPSQPTPKACPADTPSLTQGPCAWICMLSYPQLY